MVKYLLPLLIEHCQADIHPTNTYYIFLSKIYHKKEAQYMQQMICIYFQCIAIKCNRFAFLYISRRHYNPWGYSFKVLSFIISSNTTTIILIIIIIYFF